MKGFEIGLLSPRYTALPSKKGAGKIFDRLVVEFHFFIHSDKALELEIYKSDFNLSKNILMH